MDQISYIMLKRPNICYSCHIMLVINISYVNLLKKNNLYFGDNIGAYKQLIKLFPRMRHAIREEKEICDSMVHITTREANLEKDSIVKYYYTMNFFIFFFPAIYFSFLFPLFPYWMPHGFVCKRLWREVDAKLTFARHARVNAFAVRFDSFSFFTSFL